jgi:hypothetical protein
VRQFALLLLTLAATQAAEPEMLTNGEMEGPFVNGLAQGWVANCYGSNEVGFAQESTDVHGGKSAQRVTCTRFPNLHEGYYVLLDYDGRPKPTMMAYSAPESMLGDAKPFGVLRRNGLTVHLFGRGNGAIAVAWSAHARPLSWPPGVSVCDLMGNEMPSPTLKAREPVYVLAPTLKPAQLQQMLP